MKRLKSWYQRYKGMGTPVLGSMYRVVCNRLITIGDY